MDEGPAFMHVPARVMEGRLLFKLVLTDVVLCSVEAVALWTDAVAI